MAAEKWFEWSGNALRDGVSGGNGVFAYAAGNAFPASTFQSTNYWVDVVFTTSGGGGSDTTPPTVTSTSPANGASGVAVSTSVTATFSEAMDAATITTATFELRDAAGTAIGGTVSYNAGSSTATLSPVSALPAGVTYSATVKGGTTDPRVKDVAGNALAASATWSFTTLAAAPDTSPPTVTSTSPAHGATGVNRGVKVTATFSEPMDPATVGTSTVVLRDSANRTIAATVMLNAARTVATLNPTASLAARTTFTATVVGGAGGVRDSAGNALAANKTWMFTTR